MKQTKIYYILAFGDIAKVLKRNVGQSDVVRYSDKFEDNPSISYLRSELGLKMEKFREPSRSSMVITVLLSFFFKHF